MIFDVSRKEFVKAISTVRNMFTATELKKSIFSMVELQADTDGVRFVLEQDEMSFRIDLVEVNVIEPGNVRCDIHFLWDSLGSFNKDNLTLTISLYEDKAISIVGTVEDEELIAIEQEQILEVPTTFERIDGNVVIDRKELVEHLKIAKKMNKKTFHPSTEAIGFWISGNTCLIRGYNFTTFYQGILKSKTKSSSQYFAFSKLSIARLFRMLTAIKDEDISLFIEENHGYIMGSSAMIRIPLELSEDIEKAIYSLNMKVFGQMLYESDILIDDWFKVMKSNKKAKHSFVSIDMTTTELNFSDETSTELPTYPYNRVLDLISTLEGKTKVGIGTKENLYPLILVKESKMSTIRIIQMGVEENMNISFGLESKKTA